MKLFKVTASNYGFGEYKSVFIIANNEECALEIAEKGQPYNDSQPDKYAICWEFEEEQLPLLIEEVNLDKEQIVFSHLVGY